MKDILLKEVLSRRGAGKMLAEACGVSQAAVSQWSKVPFRHRRAFAAIAVEILGGGQQEIPQKDATQ